MAGEENIVETGVDDLLRLVREKKKISVAETARILRLPEKVVQQWVDFLLEEEVVGIEYRFITPYIYLNEHSPQRLKMHNKDTLTLKDEFFEKAKKKDLPITRVNVLWKQYVKENMATIREEFWQRAKGKQIAEEKIEKLWDLYRLKLLQSNEE